MVDKNIIEDLTNIIYEDRDRKIPYSQIKTWVLNYIQYLEALKNGKIVLVERINQTEYVEGKSLAKLWIHEYLLARGRASVLVGPPRTGKSHFISWLIWRTRILHPDWDIYTNIPFFFFEERFAEISIPNVYQVIRLSDLLKMSANSTLHNRIPAAIIDEMDQAVVSQEFAKSEYLSFNTLLNILGHIMIQGPLLVYHAPNDIPKALRTGAISNRILLLTIHEGKRHIFGPNTHPNDLIVSGFVPPYSTLGLVGFEIDVNVKKLEKRINAFGKIEVAQQILENIQSCTYESEIQERKSRRSEINRQNAMKRWEKAKKKKEIEINV
ncbi:MAG: hypothetical protein C0175_05540 [Caldisericum exile]|uniref:Uncharacterized protein n=1 Tax=Caldisericum exile TaxID=693075 RepID=A0A2J6X4Q7_9BACT|nr:MAG: hypothetical protein C0175_05540 [Caldisericum exile]